MGESWGVLGRGRGLRSVTSLLRRKFRRLSVLWWKPVLGRVGRQGGRKRTGGRRLSRSLRVYRGIIPPCIGRYWGGFIAVAAILGREFLLLAFLFELLRRRTVLGWIRRKGGRKGGEGRVVRILWRRGPVKGSLSGECGRILKGVLELIL